ncbi:MAG: hypothetical protein IKI68_05315, partial [Clostridia bacterium]|nr:hypothetical protein [Clostridia bacterium]
AILWICGLHSTPANTTHALLKTAYLSGFRLQGVFPPHMSPEKQNRRRSRRRSLHIWFIDRLKRGITPRFLFFFAVDS